MKSLFLVFCLWSALATLTCAGHTGTSPWGFKEYLKRNMHVLFRKLEELDRKVNQQSHSNCTYDGSTRAHGTFFPAADGINWCWCYDGTVSCTTIDSLTYNYRDEMAQAYCASKKEGKHAFAVRKDCGDPTNTYTCDDLCGTSSVFNGNLTTLLPDVAALGPTLCYDGLWFWTSHPRLELNPGYRQPNAGQINMGTYSYGASACSWAANHCGPNYCCCKVEEVGEGSGEGLEAGPIITE